MKESIVKINEDGQGFLVKGGFILTASHCVDYGDFETMALGDHYRARVTTKSGVHFKSAIIFLDPISDIAILETTGDESLEDQSSYDDFVDSSFNLPLATNPKYPDSFNVRVYSHKGEIVLGSAQMGLPDAHTIMVETESEIEGGTSGGPIVDENNEVVGIVSIVGNGNVGVHPIPSLTLPFWIYSKICSL
jgi:serine protease Do